MAAPKKATRGSAQATQAWSRTTAINMRTARKAKVTKKAEAAAKAEEAKKAEASKKAAEAKKAASASANRQCSQCKVTQERQSFSKKQWKKDPSASTCIVCQQNREDLRTFRPSHLSLVSHVVLPYAMLVCHPYFDLHLGSSVCTAAALIHWLGTAF